jgi:splicing factor 3B subunit 5
VGTGHADTTRFEWASNIQRDSYASYIGHPPLLSYMAIGMGECREKVRSMMIEVCYGVGYIFMKRRRRLIGV